MKKITIISLNILLIIILVGCSSKNAIFDEINKVAEDTEIFISISTSKRTNISVINLSNTIKIEDIDMVFSTKFRERNSLILGEAVNKMPVIQCSIANLKKRDYRSTFYYPDKNPKLLSRIELPKIIPEIDELKFCTTYKGIALSKKKASLLFKDQIKIEDEDWVVVICKYDLTDDILVKTQISELKGFLYLYYNPSNLNVVEIYKDLYGNPIVLRRFWLKETQQFNYDKLNYETILNSIKYYYKKARFEKFLEISNTFKYPGNK